MGVSAGNWSLCVHLKKRLFILGSHLAHTPTAKGSEQKENTEIRNPPPLLLHTLSPILEPTSKWKRLVSKRRTKAARVIRLDATNSISLTIGWWTVRLAAHQISPNLKAAQYWGVKLFSVCSKLYGPWACVSSAVAAAHRCLEWSRRSSLSGAEGCILHQLPRRYHLVRNSSKNVFSCVTVCCVIMP